MSLREKLEETMYGAMRKKDDLTRDTMRLVFAAIKQSEVESRVTLDDQGILTILQKEVKIRNETIKELSASNRLDLVDKATAEIEILNKFLPTQLSDEELEVITRQVIADLAASNSSDIGKVMKVILPLVKGQALPDRVSKMVKVLLNG